ncbi:MAG: DNA repair protein RecN [Holophagales bacterium]|nr:DNA repair protein RecN [Holophagales bacterium]
MIRELHIRNLAVVEEAVIELGGGFNVLSGETGAGKSIVVDSLTLLAGVRASNDLIRTGADSLTVTGVFQPRGGAWKVPLGAAGLDSAFAGEGGDAGEELVIRREISRSGRNRVYVNDQPVTLKLLADLAPHLVRIHGQREELGLVDPELQRTWLDRSGGAEARQLIESTTEAWEAYRHLAEKLARSSGDERLRQERIDYARFVIAEIETVAPEAGEETVLRQEREVLRHAESIRQGLSEAAQALFDDEDGAYGGVSRAQQALERIRAWEGGAAEWASEVEEISIRLAELETALQRRLEEVEADPRRLDEVEDRLALLERLFRKYGATSEEVLAERRRRAAELEELEGAEEGLEALQTRLEAALDSYRRAAEELSAARRRWARTLEKGVGRHLADLALAKAVFEVAIAPRPHGSSPLIVGGKAVEIGRLGYDQITYMFSPNPGEATRPLAKVASGGELSRLYLAVQLASRADGEEMGASPATLVFDEVDTGISGAQAAVLGGKVRSLARGGQILAVTHLPQVASQADIQLRVAKEVERGRTRTRVSKLDETGRVEEIARMLAGSEITELSLEHAREMIASVGGAGPGSEPMGLES